MDIRWLQDFLAVAETQNFTRAAQMRHVSQAAFSRRIKALEAWLGTALVDRTSFPTCLTPDGELFRPRAIEIVQQIADARLGGPEIGRRRQIRIALPNSLATGQLPLWWNRWSTEIGAGMPCYLTTGDLNDTVAALVTGEVDMMVCYQFAHLPIIMPDERYEHVVIGQETFFPYASPAVHDALQDVFPGRKNARLPLLMYTKSAALAQFLDIIIENAPQELIGEVIFETESASVLRAMAIADHGVAWLPGGVANDAPLGVLRRIAAQGWGADLKVVAYRDKQAAMPRLDRLWALFASLAPRP